MLRPSLWLLSALVIALCTAGCAGCFQTKSTTSTSSSPSAPAATPETFDFEPETPPTFQYENGVRLATLNTEFMFDGASDEGQASFEHQGDPAKARAHRDRIGEILRMLDADVVMLQEIEDGATLHLLVDESLAGMGYTVHFVQGGDYFTGQDVGLLSRIPVQEIGRTDERANVGATGDTYGVSKNMYARLMLGNVPATLIGVHFLARPTDASRTPRREAQAEVIRRLVVQEQKAGRAVAVLGDFNDFDDATLDLAGSTPITDVMATIKEASPGPSDDLRNLMADVPQVERYTAHYDRNDNDAVDPGELSALDHILLSPQLYRHVREVVYVQAYDPTVYTDHFPIVVNLGLDT